MLREQTSCRMKLAGRVKLGEGAVEKRLRTQGEDSLWRAMTPFVTWLNSILPLRLAMNSCPLLGDPPDPCVVSAPTNTCSVN